MQGMTLLGCWENIFGKKFTNHFRGRGSINDHNYCYIALKIKPEVPMDSWDVEVRVEHSYKCVKADTLEQERQTCWVFVNSAYYDFSADLVNFHTKMLITSDRIVAGTWKLPQICMLVLWTCAYMINVHRNTCFSLRREIRQMGGWNS